jgi:methylmalonyl-CoA/ethylmalonyl-CoA epimerase
MLGNTRFHHIGVATDDIKKTAQTYLGLGYSQTDAVFDPIQNVNIAFLEKEGSPLIELVEPVDETSPVCNVLKKVGVSAYHFCYEVDDIQLAINDLTSGANKYILLAKPIPAIALSNRKICFLYNKNTGLIELVEK